MSGEQGKNTGSKGKPGWQPTDKSKLAGKNAPTSVPRETVKPEETVPDVTVATIYETFKTITVTEDELPLTFPSPISASSASPDSSPEPHLEEKPSTIMDNLRAGQAPLILTAREIRENFQAIDGDRSDADEQVSDDVVFQRKLAESDYRGPDGETIDWDDIDEDDLYEDDDGNPIPVEKWSLVDDIKFNGIIYPVTLQEDPEEVGSQGKPEILGGHHRIAIMDEHAPEEFMPVEFYPDQDAARKGLGWKY